MNFIKIPIGLFSASTKDIRLYCAYLDFKCFNPEGRVCPPFKVKVNRFYYTYWRKKLLAKGWAMENGRCFNLLRYPEVWQDLGVLPGWNGQRYKFGYKKILIETLPLDRKEYFKVLRDMVLKTIAGNKVRQIKWKLKTKHKKDRRVNTSQTFISTRTVARLVGLRSATSGSKYRNKLFEVIPEPTTMVKTDYGYRYKCKKIAL